MFTDRIEERDPRGADRETDRIANIERAGVAVGLAPGIKLPAADTREHRPDEDVLLPWFLDPLHGRGYQTDLWSPFGKDAPIVRHGAPGVITAADVERTASGWEVSPQDMVTLLERITRYYRPAELYITENGSSYEDFVNEDGTIADLERRRYLARYLAAFQDVLAKDIPVRGYFAWSLIDNLEWAEGYTRRFGLAHVDFETQPRKLKLERRLVPRFPEAHT